MSAEVVPEAVEETPATEVTEETTEVTEEAPASEEAEGSIATLLVEDESSEDETVDADAEDSEGDGKDEGSEDSPEGAPETYVDFTLPEGLEVSKERLEAAQDVFKKHNLSQEAAQDFINLQAEAEVERIKETESQRRETIEGWRGDLEKDPVLGREKLKSTQVACGKALRAFDIALEGKDGEAGETLTQLLDRTGLGNHKTVIAFLTAVGTAIQEDSGSGGGAADDGLTPAQRFYPTMRP